jgi:hypothetical protein
MKGGPPSRLNFIEHDICKFIVERREQGFGVSHHSAIMRASKLMPSFSNKFCNEMLSWLVWPCLSSWDTSVTEITHACPWCVAVDFLMMSLFLYGPSEEEHHCGGNVSARSSKLPSVNDAHPLVNSQLEINHMGTWFLWTNGRRGENSLK